jgi:MFS family permease
MGDLFGPCLFAFFMGVGRLIYGIKGEKINIKTGFIATSVLCVICYIVASVSLNPFISLLGCALTGLSVSLMWPGTYSLGAETFPKAGTALFSILALFGDLGCSSGPYLAGVVSDMAQKSTKLCELGALYGMSADSIGLKLGIITAVIYPILMLVGVFLLKKTNTSKALKE